MTIYLPIKIKSADQVNPLPIGTLVFDAESDGWIQPHIKVGTPDRWFWMGDDEGEPGDAALVGWTALVPTEVDQVSAEFTGVAFKTERHSLYPFTAYYVDKEAE